MQLADASRKAGAQATQLQQASDDLAEARRAGAEKDRAIDDLTSKAGSGDSAVAALRREAEDLRRELTEVRREREDLRGALQVRTWPARKSCQGPPSRHPNPLPLPLSRPYL